MPKPHRPARWPISRRNVLKTLVLGAAAAAGLTTRPSRAGESGQRLDVHDPAAVALGYVENAGQVDTKKFPKFVPGSNCDNCLQLQGKPGNDYRPCGLFPGKLVSVSGWCSGWTAEM
ncbi:MAG TPA: high-potential iron-sulfur protein [Steroidobacteraceae bacterium]